MQTATKGCCLRENCRKMAYSGSEADKIADTKRKRMLTKSKSERGKEKMTELYEVPANIDELFREVKKNGGTRSYRIINYAEDMAMDNNESMAHFVESAGIPEECIEDDEGTQIIVTHPDYRFKIQIDAGGLGDFFSHGFECTALRVKA